MYRCMCVYACFQLFSFFLLIFLRCLFFSWPVDHFGTYSKVRKKSIKTEDRPLTEFEKSWHTL